MKKSIISLSVLLCTFSNASFASNSKPLVNNTSIQSDDVNTALVVAIYKGDIESVKKFLNYGANVNEKSNGMSPLMHAARYNKVEIIKILISSGAKINARDNNGLTALNYAKLSNANEAVVLLKQYK